VTGFPGTGWPATSTTPMARRWSISTRLCWRASACSTARSPDSAAAPTPRAPAVMWPVRTCSTCSTAWASAPAWICARWSRSVTGSAGSWAGRMAPGSAGRWASTDPPGASSTSSMSGFGHQIVDELVLVRPGHIRPEGGVLQRVTRRSGAPAAKGARVNPRLDLHRPGAGTAKNRSSSMPHPLWIPTPERIAHSRMDSFRRHVNRQFGLALEDYAQLHEWSIRQRGDFWQSLAEFFGVHFHTPATSALEENGYMTRARWFSGAALNYAEHLLQGDDRQTALISRDEGGQRVVLTYAERRAPVAGMQRSLRGAVVDPGDRVSSILPT